MNTVQLKKGQEREYARGQLNIEKDDLSEDAFLKDGEIVRLTDHFGQFVGIAIISFEQKTKGWIISRDENASIDRTFVAGLLEEAIGKRSPLYNQEDTNVFRLFNEIGDGLGGLVIDNYDGHLLVTFYSRGIYKIRDLIIKELMSQLNPSSITEQTRFSMDGRMQIDNRRVLGNVTFPITVLESGLRFSIDLDDGPMTRLFLDQRETRKALLKNTDGAKTFLNLFAYSGTFSIAAAAGGMATTSVDAANRTKELITDNFNANNLAVDGHTINIMDTFEFLKYAQRHNHRYDTILIDPPSFSRFKKKVFKVDRDYPKLISEAVKVLNRGGTLILSQNLETFTLNQFKKQIEQTLDKSGTDYSLEDIKGLPKDFPTVKGYKKGKYLKVVSVKVG